MNPAIYEEKRSLRNQISLNDFVRAIDPLLQRYKLPGGYWRDDAGNSRRIYGDSTGAYLEHYATATLVSDGYSACGGIEFVKSYGLTDPLTGEEFKLSIRISRLLYTNDEIEVSFKGDAGEVEKFKQAVEFLLIRHCL